ncbi:MAG TPA: MFS transporter [Acidimicrobiales bacterium]|nr:MFS transporter [Acidimicrobiales bacterium]
MSSTLTTPVRARPLHEDPRIHARRWFLLAIMCLSLVLVVMSISGLVTAIPTMQEALDASASQVAWILDAYAIVFAGSLLTAGALGDRFGRKRALLAGLVVFGAGALVAGLASSAAQVIAGRGVMGIGAALVMPATLSIITTIFPPEERGRAIAVWAGFAGAGGAIGPIVSGALLESYWWGSAVLVNLPLVAATFIAIWLFAPESRDENQTPLDPIGAVLSLAGLGALVFTIIQGGENGWTTTPVLIAAVAAVVTLVGFLRWERRTEHPMLPLTLFDDRRFSVGSAVVTVAFFVLFGFFFLATQYLQFARQYSPLEAGLALLPLPIAFVAASPRSAVLAARYGAGRVMAAGLVIVAGGFILLSDITPTSPYLLLAVAFGVLGVGTGLTAAPATGEIMSAVPLSKAGVGSAMNDTTRELGGALGIAILGSIATSAYRSAINVSGLGLGAGEQRLAEESIGAAARVAAQAPAGAGVSAHAASAYTDAFALASAVSVGVVLVAAIAVWFFSRKRDIEPVEELGDEMFELELAMVPVGVGDTSE